MYCIQLIINGILLGSVYALIGLGMSIILGIAKLTNLAHGVFVVLGAYISAALVSIMGVDPLITLASSVPLMFLLGYLLQYFLISRAMKKGNEAALLVSFGLSIVVQDLLLIIFSADVQSIPAAYSIASIHIGTLVLSVLNLLLFGISLTVIIFLWIFLNKSYIGRAIRAASDDLECAALCGASVEKIYAIAMGVAMASAAVAGLCVGMKWTFSPSSGGNYLLTSFAVVVIGGLGSVPGTLIAGMLFGLAQVLGGPNYGLLISYVLLVLVLVVKPKGIFGK